VLCFIKTDLSVKTENDKVETTVKLNDDPEKIKETITGQPGDIVKVCLEESYDNSRYCQTIMSLSQYYQLNQSKLYHYHQYIMHP
jgi:DNA replication protein DnaD